jgi:hypothetical protein
MTHTTTRFFACAAALVLIAAPIACAAERNEVRMLVDFEDEKELASFKYEDTVRLSLDDAAGVTHGKKSCHVVTKAGGWASFEVSGAPIQNWANFDYLAVDIFTNHTQRLPMTAELWDKNSKDYATRCTFDDFFRTHPGQNTVLFPIAHAKRNNKEGLEWNELEEKDKIDLNGLTRVKFILPAGLDNGECQLWFDNIRLLQEDAAGQRLQVHLPASAKAFDFGPKSLATAGFEPVTAGDSRFKGHVVETNCKWPETLTGSGVQSQSDEPFEFETPLPDGDYCVWLSARKVIAAQTRQFKLLLGGQTLNDETLTDADFYGEKGIFRHLRTQYSQRPNALWLDFVQPVNPEWKTKVKVAGGKLNIAAVNFHLGAMIVMPAAEEAAFNAAIDELNQARIKQFYATMWLNPPPLMLTGPGDGAYVLWTAPAASEVRPWTEPPEPRTPAVLNAAAAPGQHSMLTLCVTAYDDLGAGDIEISELTGPGGRIPASAIKCFFQNYRLNIGSGAAESAVLLPWTKIKFEAGMTWAYVLWLNTPADAKPGVYEGTVKFKPQTGGESSVPLKLEVYPFKLIDPVPGSFGLYQSGWQFPAGIDQQKMWREMLAFMREIGLTATGCGYGFTVDALVPGPDGKQTVKLSYDDRLWSLVKAAGMGRSADQRMWGDILGGTRTIARLLGMQPSVDLDPGLELRHANTAELKELFKDMVRQAYAHYEALGLPVVFQAADEPRAMPNPWNRKLADTITYLDLIKEVNPRIPREEDAMGDVGSADDNTALVNRVEVLSTQGAPHAAGIIAAAQKAGVTIWIYNTSHSRFSFGFYLEKLGAKGHWEWDEPINGQQVQGAPINGYPFPLDWYTPFCGPRTLGYRAPYSQFPAGLLYSADMFELSEGITDYVYLATLKKLIREKPDSEPAQQARKFLETLKSSLPPFATEPKFATPDAAAAVGAPPETPLPQLCELWRRKTAEFITALSK